MKRLLLTLLMVAVVAPSIYACGCGCEKKEKKGEKECGMPRCDGLKLKECEDKEEKAPVVKKEKKTKKAKKDRSCCKTKKTCCTKKETKEASKTAEK